MGGWEERRACVSLVGQARLDKTRQDKKIRMQGKAGSG